MSRPLTHMLHAVTAGDQCAAAELLPVVYEELRRLARSRMAKLPPGQTLQTTALVHEAYLRLVGSEEITWEGRGHFFFAAARAMHDIVVEDARRKATRKRGGGRRRLDVDRLQIAIDDNAEELLCLHEVLAEIEREDERGHQILMLRFFAGLTEEQIADVMGLSARTVRRDWRYLRVALHKRMSAYADEELTDE